MWNGSSVVETVAFDTSAEETNGHLNVATLPHCSNASLFLPLLFAGLQEGNRAIEIDRCENGVCPVEPSAKTMSSSDIQVIELTRS